MGFEVITNSKYDRALEVNDHMQKKPQFLIIRH